MLSVQPPKQVTSEPPYFNNWRVKQDDALPYCFGDALRFEIDQTDPSEIIVRVSRKREWRVLNRSERPSSISTHNTNLVEVIYYFTDDCISRADAPLGFSCQYKLCFHLVNDGKNVCFLFQVHEALEDVDSEDSDLDSSTRESYLGSFLLEHF